MEIAAFYPLYEIAPLYASERDIKQQEGQCKKQEILYGFFNGHIMQ